VILGSARAVPASARTNARAVEILIDENSLACASG
jgi:hypothetical protein